MAKLPTSSPPQAPQLSATQLRTRISRIQRIIGELQNFDPNSVQARSDPRIKSLEVSIQQVLNDSFGYGPERDVYITATSLDRAGVRMGGGTPLPEIVQGLIKGKESAIGLLNRAIEALEYKIADLGDPAASQEPVPVSAEFSKDVFVVHGHDDLAKAEVALLIQRAGLNPVILHDKPNAGRTIIEKFEELGELAGFAVVLLTPDDVGGPNRDNLQRRARQNVIGEMFWFAGKLGRRRICALKKGDLEIPTDVVNIVYTNMDVQGAWKAELLRELKAAGYEVDWDRALAGA
jgi:predicted nucleotide-binding protein